METFSAKWLLLGRFIPTGSERIRLISNIHRLQGAGLQYKNMDYKMA
jgi:hypothetical protein